MNHPISDGLTVDEQRAVLAAFLQMVEAHDRHGDTRILLQGVLHTARLAETLANSVPDDAGWAHYGDVEPVSGSLEVPA